MMLRTGSRSRSGGGRDADGFVAACRREKINFDLRGERFELFDRGRTIDVDARQQHFLFHLLAQHLGQLAARRGLARALQSGHQDHRGRRGRKIERGIGLPHQRDKFAMHDTHQRLAGGEAAHYLLTQRAFAHPLDEVPHHRQRDVRLE